MDKSLSEMYPYLASWCTDEEEAETDMSKPNSVWIHWNGIYGGTPPKRVIYQGKKYTFEEFRKEVWNI